MKKTLNLSCEFFPPKTEEGLNKIIAAAHELSQINPRLFSVTFGAVGSTQDNTFKAIRVLKKLDLAPIAPHLTCIGSTKENINALIELYKNEGFHHIVALRGDLPAGMNDPGIFKYANELIEYIRAKSGDLFTLYCAAYPEMHPQATNASDDFNHLVNKFNVGANAGITQYFFNPDSYLYLRDELIKKGIKAPLIAGIMPITNFSQLDHFSNMCGAEIPRWLRNQLSAFGDDLESLREFGLDVMSKLCQRLINEGVCDFHFYTLNQAEPTLNVVRRLDSI